MIICYAFHSFYVIINQLLAFKPVRLLVKCTKFNLTFTFYKKVFFSFTFMLQLRNSIVGFSLGFQNGGFSFLCTCNKYSQTWRKTKKSNDLKKRVFELVEMSTSQAAHTQSFLFVLKENNFLTEYNRDRKKLVVEKMKRLLRPKKRTTKQNLNVQ